MRSAMFGLRGTATRLSCRSLRHTVRKQAATHRTKKVLPSDGMVEDKKGLAMKEKKPAR